MCMSMVYLLVLFLVFSRKLHVNFHNGCNPIKISGLQSHRLCLMMAIMILSYNSLNLHFSDGSQFGTLLKLLIDHLYFFQKMQLDYKPTY